ncbi:MAG: uroporphyrinogen decarboxylase family protein [Planctomycetota bacterium]|jgi:uroporphyrinogen decarboxylase
MTHRELWNRIMFYGEFDRMPVVHWTGWPETLERWRGEGLPEGADQHDFFNASPMWARATVNLGLHPEFEEEVLEETAEYRIFRQKDGVVCQDWKHRSCIPHFIDFTLKDASGWDEYKKRLQPDPARIPEDLDEKLAKAEASGLPVAVGTASLMGWIRNWMGVENMSYLMYDAPEVYAEMVTTIADLVCWGIDVVLPKIKADLGFGWEDICGKSGPLVSPPIFDRCVAPAYAKVAAKLADYGVKLYGIDTDGDISALCGRWLEAGVNLQFPIEIGTWQADPMAYRRQYGRDLRVFGGIDKRELAKGRAAIDAEIERRKPLMAEGGYVPLPDHLIPPDVPLDDYRYYLDRIRELRF